MIEFIADLDYKYDVTNAQAIVLIDGKLEENIMRFRPYSPYDDLYSLGITHQQRLIDLQVEGIRNRRELSMSPYSLTPNPYARSYTSDAFYDNDESDNLRSFRKNSHAMTWRKAAKYALIGVAYGAIGAAASMSAPLGLTTLGIGAAVGAVTLPAARMLNKTLGRTLAYGPMAATAIAIPVTMFGLGNIVTWSFLGAAAVGGCFATTQMTSMRARPISTLPRFDL